MSNEVYLSISEFAKLTGIKRANLIYYDNVGVLTPELRGANGYRYYSHRQLGSAYLILALREIGIGLDEIKSYTDQRTPQKMIKLLNEQGEHIQSEIEKLLQLKDMMELYTEMAQEYSNVDSDRIYVRLQEKQPLFLGPYSENPISKSLTEQTETFYDYAELNGMPLSYPFGSIIEKPDLLSGNFGTVQRFYFKTKRSNHSFKPAGRYVVGYAHGDYGQSTQLYVRLLQYIKENGLHICGDAYEEYPLDQLSIQNPDEYLIKVEIMVE